MNLRYPILVNRISSAARYEKRFFSNCCTLSGTTASAEQDQNVGRERRLLPAPGNRASQVRCSPWRMSSRACFSFSSGAVSYLKICSCCCRLSVEPLVLDGNHLMSLRFFHAAVLCAVCSLLQDLRRNDVVYPIGSRQLLFRAHVRGCHRFVSCV